MNMDDHKAEPGQLSRAAKLDVAMSMLNLLMAQIDWTQGNCMPDEPIGSVVSEDVIASMRRGMELLR